MKLAKFGDCCLDSGNSKKLIQKKENSISIQNMKILLSMHRRNTNISKSETTRFGLSHQRVHV